MPMIVLITTNVKMDKFIYFLNWKTKFSQQFEKNSDYFCNQNSQMRLAEWNLCVLTFL